MSFIKTDDNVKLYYETVGKGEPIIFAHEFAGDHRSWEPQVNYFSRYNQCITYCARGYYPSEVPQNETQYSQERAWRDILSVMDNLNIEKAHVVGLSMGGFATLHFGINAPDRVLSLVIAGCGYGAMPIEKSTFNKEADFSNVSLDTAQNILNKGMEKVGSEYALGPSRVQFQNKSQSITTKLTGVMQRHLAIRDNKIFPVEQRLGRNRTRTRAHQVQQLF